MSGRSLWVGLLGPLEVRIDGAAVAVHGGKPATVLAVLALSAGQPVALSAMAEAVWPERPPERVAGSLQTHVMRLRRVVGPRAIQTFPSAYLLDLEPDRVDVLRFRRLVAEARAQEDAVGRRRLLVEALALWRGEPLSGLRSEALSRHVVPLLVEERLGALQLRIDVDLAAGRHAELVPELRGLTGRFPLREPLWCQLIAALSGCGRQAEAVEAYHGARIQLREQLGLDPSAELQDLYRRLLGGEPVVTRR